MILDNDGNVISGQVASETAKQLSERFGKIMQDQESISINWNDTSISRSKRFEVAILQSNISSLSSGEFVGMMAYNPDQKIKLKTFSSEIINDNTALSTEQASYTELSEISKVNQSQIIENYLEIKKDIADIIQDEMERMLDSPYLSDLRINKN